MREGFSGLCRYNYVTKWLFKKLNEEKKVSTLQPYIYKISTNFLKGFWITFPFYSKPQSIHKLHRPSCVLIRQSQTCCVMLREDTCWTDVYAWYIIFFFLSYWFYPPGLNDIPRIQKDISIYCIFRYSVRHYQLQS